MSSSLTAPNLSASTSKVCTPQTETMTAGVTALDGTRWVESQTVSRPVIPPGGALVKMTGCGLCGSDLEKLLHGKATPGQVLGHELVGVVVALDKNQPVIHNFNVGDRVVSAHHVPCQMCDYCRQGSESMCRQFKNTNFDPGGFAEYVALTDGHLKHTAFHIPDHVSDEKASAVEPLACVLRGIDRAGDPKNAAVTVIGLGFIGLMASQVYTQRGYSVTGIDVNPERQQLARDHGWVQQAWLPDAVDHGFHNTQDVVFLTVLHPETMTLALNLLRDGGTVVVFSGSKPNSVTLDPNELYFREISVIPSYSPSLHHLQQAATLIFDGGIDVGTLCTHRRSLSEMDEAIRLYKSGSAIKVLITP